MLDVRHAEWLREIRVSRFDMLGMRKIDWRHGSMEYEANMRFSLV
jgi:hypothetical protein